MGKDSSARPKAMTNEEKVMPTDAQRIEALQRANPKMTRKEACELLGIKDEPDMSMPDFFSTIFKGFKSK